MGVEATAAQGDEQKQLEAPSVAAPARWCGSFRQGSFRQRVSASFVSASFVSASFRFGDDRVARAH